MNHPTHPEKVLLKHLTGINSFSSQSTKQGVQMRPREVVSRTHAPQLVWEACKAQGRPLQACALQRVAGAGSIVGRRYSLQSVSQLGPKPSSAKLLPLQSSLTWRL